MGIQVEPKTARKMLFVRYCDTGGDDSDADENDDGDDGDDGDGDGDDDDGDDSDGDGDDDDDEVADAHDVAWGYEIVRSQMMNDHIVLWNAGKYPQGTPSPCRILIVIVYNVQVPGMDSINHIPRNWLHTRMRIEMFKKKCFIQALVLFSCWFFVTCIQFWNQEESLILHIQNVS